MIVSREAPLRALYLLYSHYASDPRPRRQAEALRDAGWKVTVLSLGGPDETKPFVLDGVEVVPCRMPRYRGTQAGGYLRGYLRFFAWAATKVVRQANRYDLVHIHAPPDFLAFAAIPARLGGARLLLDIHDLTPELFQDRFGDRYRAVLWSTRLLERWSAALVHQVVTVNEQCRRVLHEHGTDRARVAVILNLPEENIFWRDNPRPLPEKPVLAYHGTLVPRYGPQVLLEAAALLLPSYPDLTVRIIGDGDMKPELVKRAAQPDLAGHVYISPERIPVTAVPDALGSVTAGVVANRVEGYTSFVLPTKLLEYLALGIPAVVTETETVDYYFERDEVVTISRPDPSGLADALRPLIEDPQAALTKVVRARKFFERHAWSRERESYVQIAERLARRTKGNLLDPQRT